MIQLIKLEWKKHNLKNYIKRICFICMSLSLFVFAMDFWGIANDPDTGLVDTAPGMDMISMTIEMLTNIAFLTLTGMMFSAFIIETYHNKTMQLMFTYPIKRKKILLSQMLSVWIFNVIAMILTRFVMFSCIQIGELFGDGAFLLGFDMATPSFYLQLITKSIVTVSISFIALYIGMKFRSTRAVMVASLGLIFLTQANIGDFSLANNTMFPLILTGISFFLAFWSIHNIDSKDIL